MDDSGLTWEQRDLSILWPNNNPNIEPPRLAHLTLSEYLLCGHISRIQFDAYFKFAFVRNHWVRAVSTYKYISHINGIRQPFKDFVKQELTNSNSKLAYFYKPQSDYVFDHYGRANLDYIGKFEELNKDFVHIVNHLGLEGDLKHINSSNKKPSLNATTRKAIKNFYDQEIKSIASDFYARDTIAFGYCF